MATRVGKYKLSKRDSALSLADGGTISGDLNIVGNITGISGNINVSESVFTTTSNPSSAGQLFVTSSAYNGSTLSEITASAAFLMVSQG